MKYGINTKNSKILAIISTIIGVVILVLKLTKVLKDDYFTMVAVIFFLLAFAIYLRPKSKIIKRESELILKYREDFYREMTKDCKKEINVKSITFKEDEFGKFSFGKIIFDNLSKQDFFTLSTKLINDFIEIFYRVDTSKMSKEEKKINKNKATIDNFEIIVKFNDKTEYHEKKIDNYIIIK